MVEGALRVTIANEGFAPGACAVLVEYANGDWAETLPIPITEELGDRACYGGAM